jgi:hypothetical protein
MKKYIYAIILLSALSCYPATAQENFLFHDVQKAKQSDMVFQDVSASLTKLDVKDKSILKHFSDENEVRVFRYTPPSGKKRLGSALSLKLPIENKEAELELLEVPSSYEVVTSDGQKYPANS